MYVVNIPTYPDTVHHACMNDILLTSNITTTFESADESIFLHIQGSLLPYYYYIYMHTCMTYKYDAGESVHLSPCPCTVPTTTTTTTIRAASIPEGAMVTIYQP